MNIIVFSVCITYFFFSPTTLLGGGETRVWTGTGGNNDFNNPLNWFPQGFSFDDTLHIPQTSNDPELTTTRSCYSITLEDTLYFTGLGALNTTGNVSISPQGRLIISSTSTMTLGGKLIIDSGASINISSAITVTSIDDDVVLNGSLVVNAGIQAAIWCRGDWIRGTGSSFSPGASTFYFTNTSRQLNVDRGTFHNVILGPVLNSLRIAGNVNVNGTLLLRGSVEILDGDTLTINNRNTIAVNDTLGGRILRGAVRRLLDQASTDTIRFHDRNIAIQFLNTAGIPNSLIINPQPEPDTSTLQCRFTFVRRYYDLDSEGGGSFTARLFLRYEESELEPGVVEDSLRLWRSSDGCNWVYVPSRVDPINNIVVADTVRAFSKWGFGTPKGPATSVQLMDHYIPEQIALSQNYPNPFNPSTTIGFDLDRKSLVILNVFNLIGQEVAALVHQELLPGRYEFEWRPEDLPSGIYFYRLKVGTATQARKMVLLR